MVVIDRSCAPQVQEVVEAIAAAGGEAVAIKAPWRSKRMYDRAN
ncbi:hypothetical protein [Methylocapsa aurea]